MQQLNCIFKNNGLCPKTRLKSLRECTAENYELSSCNHIWMRHAHMNVQSCTSGLLQPDWVAGIDSCYQERQGHQ